MDILVFTIEPIEKPTLKYEILSLFIPKLNLSLYMNDFIVIYLILSSYRQIYEFKLLKAIINA
jgi:hypothetical protein